MPDRYDQESVGLPFRPFLYTLDQIASMLDLSDMVLRGLVFYDNRSIGAKKADQILARNIAVLGNSPDWRVTEVELIRWMKKRRFRVYYRGWPTA